MYWGKGYGRGSSKREGSERGSTWVRVKKDYLQRVMVMKEVPLRVKFDISYLRVRVMKG